MFRMSNKRAAALALVLGMILTLAVSLQGFAAYSDSMQGGVARQVIRFQVRANSDLEDDQSLKTLVKDKVLDNFRHELESASSLEQTREFLTGSITDIQEYAAEVVAEAGYNYPVTATVTTDYFPTKAYANVRLPAGNYETLRIDIGVAEGENWWCVMFPPLCFVDVSMSEIPAPEKKQLQSILTEDEYALITGDGTDIQVRFKIVEIWQRLKAENQLHFAGK